MKTRDFEQAIMAIGAELLCVRYNPNKHGEVDCCYGRLNDYTFIKWDENGRSFVYNIDPESQEDCAVGCSFHDLPYERDKHFDLTF